MEKWSHCCVLVRKENWVEHQPNVTNCHDHQPGLGIGARNYELYLVAGQNVALQGALHSDSTVCCSSRLTYRTLAPSIKSCFQLDFFSAGVQFTLFYYRRLRPCTSIFRKTYRRASLANHCLAWKDFSLRRTNI